MMFCPRCSRSMDHVSKGFDGTQYRCHFCNVNAYYGDNYSTYLFDGLD